MCRARPVPLGCSYSEKRKTDDRNFGDSFPFLLMQVGIPLCLEACRIIAGLCADRPRQINRWRSPKPKIWAASSAPRHVRTGRVRLPRGSLEDTTWCFETRRPTISTSSPLDQMRPRGNVWRLVRLIARRSGGRGAPKAPSPIRSAHPKQTPPRRHASTDGTTSEWCLDGS